MQGETLNPDPNPKKPGSLNTRYKFIDAQPKQITEQMHPWTPRIISSPVMQGETLNPDLNP